MEGVSRPAGSGVPIEWNGRTVIMQPLGLRHWGMIEQELLSTRPDPLEIAKRIRTEMDPLPDGVLERLVAEAYRDAKASSFATQEEVMAYFTSPRGLATALWLSFRQDQPNITREEVLEIVDSLPPEEQERYQKLLLQASGLDDRGNSTGPPQKTTGRAEPQENGS